jgi:hypothetical protein
MDRQPPAGKSNVLVYVVLGLLGVGAAGFFYLLFAELFFIVVGGVGLVGGLGLLHYFWWGRAMTEAAKKEAKANLEGE